MDQHLSTPIISIGEFTSIQHLFFGYPAGWWFGTWILHCLFSHIYIYIGKNNPISSFSRCLKHVKTTNQPGLPWHPVGTRPPLPGNARPEAADVYWPLGHLLGGSGANVVPFFETVVGWLEEILQQLIGGLCIPWFVVSLNHPSKVMQDFAGPSTVSMAMSQGPIYWRYREVPTIYQVYIRPKFQGISPQKMANNMVLTYLHSIGSWNSHW